MTALLEIENLHTEIRLRRSVVHALAGVSLTVEAGECLGIVGESGCGKTMTALSIMRLLPGGGRITAGRITVDGTNITALPEDRMRDVRGNLVGMVFQDPLTSLNPTKTIGDQIAESVRLHRGAGQAGRAGPRGGGARAGRHAPSRRAGGQLPAPAVRRHAAARDDRHGAGLRAQAADRRRADHRAGRHHRQADPGADRRPARQAGDGGHPGHPRPGRHRRPCRPGRGHVRRAGGGNRRHHGAVRRPAPPVHRGAVRGAAGKRGPGWSAGCTTSRASRRTSPPRRPAVRSRRAAATPGTPAATASRT